MLFQGDDIIIWAFPKRLKVISEYVNFWLSIWCGCVLPDQQEEAE